jgi:hypothetical protein
VEKELDKMPSVPVQKPKLRMALSNSQTRQAGLYKQPTVAKTTVPKKARVEVVPAAPEPTTTSPVTPSLPVPAAPELILTPKVVVLTTKKGKRDPKEEE